MRRFAVIAFFLAVCSGAASAAETTSKAPPLDPTALLLAYVKSPGYLNSVQKVLPLAEAPPLRARCKEMELLDANGVIIVQTPVFVPADGGLHIDGGAWINIVSAQRCGERVKRRLLVTAICIDGRGAVLRA